MPKPYKRKIMRKFRISEISGVDVPAQEGARVSIMKRDDGAPRREVKKIADLATSVEEGHQHSINVSCYDGRAQVWIGYAVAEDADTGHDHDIVLEGGEYKLTVNAGHTHTVEAGDIAAAMVAQLQKEGDVKPEDTAAMKADNERLGKIVALNATLKAHYDGLESDAKDSFLAKSAKEQEAEVEAAKVAKREAEEAAKAADPVVYTTSAGTEIRKSDGATVLAMAKAQDAQAEELKKEREANAELRKAAETASFEKRAADELSHLPGTVAHRAALLKAAEGIADEEARKAAVAALKAQNAAMAPAFNTLGTAAGGEITKGDASPQVKLDELAKKHQEANAGMSFEKAQAAVLDTPEGEALYAQVLAAEGQGVGAMTH